MGIGGNCERIARQILEYSRTPENSAELGQLVLKLEDICNGACKELEEELITIKT
jgi:hypothetical protein